MAPRHRCLDVFLSTRAYSICVYLQMWVSACKPQTRRDDTYLWCKRLAQKWLGRRNLVEEWR